MQALDFLVGAAGFEFSSESMGKKAFCSPVCSPVSFCSPALSCELPAIAATAIRHWQAHPKAIPAASPPAPHQKPEPPCTSRLTRATAGLELPSPEPPRRDPCSPPLACRSPASLKALGLGRATVRGGGANYPHGRQARRTRPHPCRRMPPAPAGQHQQASTHRPMPGAVNHVSTIPEARELDRVQGANYPHGRQARRTRKVANHATPWTQRAMRGATLFFGV